MPRLGDDPNVATAYPDRSRVNLRGGWMRQMLTTAAGTLFMFFIMTRILTNDYKDDTKSYLSKKGVDESRIDRIVPKTSQEKLAAARKAELEKKDAVEKTKYLMEEVANLTRAVLELQEIAEKSGVKIEQPLYVPPPKEEKEGEDGATTPKEGGVVVEGAGEGAGGGIAGGAGGGDEADEASAPAERLGEKGKGGEGSEGGGQTRRGLRSMRGRKMLEARAREQRKVEAAAIELRDEQQEQHLKGGAQ